MRYTKLQMYIELNWTELKRIENWKRKTLFGIYTSIELSCHTDGQTDGRRGSTLIAVI